MNPLNGTFYVKIYFPWYKSGIFRDPPAHAVTFEFWLYLRHLLKSGSGPNLTIILTPATPTLR